jgi:hypothetical protein
MTRTLAIILGLGLALVPACKDKSSGEKGHAGEHAAGDDDKGHGERGHEEEGHEEEGHEEEGHEEEGHDEGMVTLTPMSRPAPSPRRWPRRASWCRRMTAWPGWGRSSPAG